MGILDNLNPINAISTAIFGDKGIAGGITDTLKNIGVLKDTEAIAKTEQALRDYDIALKEKGNEVLKIHLENTNKARDMQIEALKQGDTFSKRFIYYYAAFISFATIVYVYFITFWHIPEPNIHFANTVLGFLLGTMLTTVINFFFGSSKGSNDKQDKMHELTTSILRGKE